VEKKQCNIIISTLIHRKLEDLISKNSTKIPVIMLVGPRQCGKSTILNFLADEKK
jgi:predicted AAA+ superfamily ATPase